MDATSLYRRAQGVSTERRLRHNGMNDLTKLVRPGTACYSRASKFARLHCSQAASHLGKGGPVMRPSLAISALLLAVITFSRADNDLQARQAASSGRSSGTAVEAGSVTTGLA